MVRFAVFSTELHFKMTFNDNKKTDFLIGPQFFCCSSLVTKAITEWEKQGELLLAMCLYPCGYIWVINPIALRKTKAPYRFGHSECSRVNRIGLAITGH